MQLLNEVIFCLFSSKGRSLSRIDSSWSQPSKQPTNQPASLADWMESQCANLHFVFSLIDDDRVCHRNGHFLKVFISAESVQFAGRISYYLSFWIYLISEFNKGFPSSEAYTKTEPFCDFWPGNKKRERSGFVRRLIFFCQFIIPVTNS